MYGGGGGTVSNTEQSCVKTPGCTMYRSLYGSVWFGLVAYKMIYHNSGLTVLKGVDSPVSKVQYGTVTKQLLRP